MTLLTAATMKYPRVTMSTTVIQFAGFQLIITGSAIGGIFSRFFSFVFKSAQILMILK